MVGRERRVSKKRLQASRVETRAARWVGDAAVEGVEKGVAAVREVGIEEEGRRAMLWRCMSG